MVRLCKGQVTKSSITLPAQAKWVGRKWGRTLSSPHRGIAIAVMLASWPTPQWISAARAQIAVKTHRIAKVIFCNAHRTAQITLTSRDSHRGLLKHIVSQTCIA